MFSFWHNFGTVWHVYQEQLQNNLILFCCMLSSFPVRSEWNFKITILNIVLLFGIFSSSYDIAFRWMPPEFTDDKSTLVQVMAGCCQATSHSQCQCWPRTTSPYGITRLQWVNVRIAMNVEVNFVDNDMVDMVFYIALTVKHLLDWYNYVFGMFVCVYVN